MGFLQSFVDELVKTANAEGALKGIARRLPGLGSLAMVGAGGAALGHTYGKRKGERQGIGEGLALSQDVARRAYRAGVEQGAEEMRNEMTQSSSGDST